MSNQTMQTEPSTPGMDIRQHEQTWRSFIGMLKWAVAGLAVLIVFLYFVIQP
jgi:hypothetical protein